MEINNTLFQTLLRQQNITEFRAFRIDPAGIGNSKLENNIKIDYRYVNLNNIYAYIKDDIFHLCDEKFEEIKISDIYFPEKGIHRIGYNEDEYFYPVTDNVNSLVVNSDGRIVSRNPKEFFYVGTNEFIESLPTFVNDFEDGLLYDFINAKFITPSSYNFWEGYKQDYNASTPKVEDIKLFANGVAEDNLLYLFSVKKFFNPPHTISYFTNSANKSIIYFESSKYGSDKRELRPVCLWYTNHTVFAISIALINKFDSEDNIISLDDTYSHRISFEVKVNSGNTFDCGTSAILEFYGRLDNKYDLEYFYNNLEFIPTRNSLLILFSDDYRNSYHTIIITEKGVITLCKHIECSGVVLTENNILRLGNYESDSAEYCDIYGTRFCTADKHTPKAQIFTRNLREPNTFNSTEIDAQKSHNQRSYYNDDVYYQLEGVIDLQGGNVIVPPCYSKIQLKEFSCDFEDYLDSPIYVSIVRIDNFFNGQLKSYFGIYQNDKLVTPIIYSNIQFIKYKSPQKDVFEIRELEDDQFFKEHESCFILIERDGSYGLASQFGIPILEPCADSYRILVEHKLIPIKNEDNKIYLKHIPNFGPEYIALCKDEHYNLIYRNQIISDFTIDDFELISLEDSYGNELFFIKVFCNSREALVYNGKFITDFFPEVHVSLSKFGNSNDSEVGNFVLKLIDDDGNSSLLNCKSKTVIEFSSHHIDPFLNYVKVDSQILDINRNIIFDAKHHTLIDEKKGCANNHIMCFHDENVSSEYIVITTDGEVVKINTDDDSNEIEFNVGGWNNYYFDTDLLRFEIVPVNEEEDDDYCYDDYPDDTDYERDTFYALGGDDYDEWKNNGGNLDDMMDGMGL